MWARRQPCPVHHIDRPAGRVGFAGAESGRIRIGDIVAVFAQGPIGLCATAGATLCGATTTIIGVDTVPERLDMARRMGADLKPLVTHRYKLDDIEAAYDLFAHQRDGVLKVAITP